MNWRTLILVASAGLSSAPAVANSWLCIAEQGVGFVYEGRKWKSTIFRNTDKLKLIIRQPNQDDREFLSRPNILGDRNPKWIVIPLGEPFPTMACEEAGNPNFVICDGAIQELRLNKASLRFQYIYRPGFIGSTDETDQPGDNPSIEIGRCSAI